LFVLLILLVLDGEGAWIMPVYFRRRGPLEAALPPTGKEHAN
jgi:hypothetical protein